MPSRNDLSPLNAREAFDLNDDGLESGILDVESFQELREIVQNDVIEISLPSLGPSIQWKKSAA